MSTIQNHAVRDYSRPRIGMFSRLWLQFQLRTTQFDITMLERQRAAIEAALPGLRASEAQLLIRLGEFFRSGSGR